MLGVGVHLDEAQGVRFGVFEHDQGNGGRILQPVHSLGPHGCRAVVVDSEGNRLALHATGAP